MIGLYNADSSFFSIEILDAKIKKPIISDDVISLTIGEEIQKASSGTLTLFDPHAKYPALLRMGMRVKISWGYKDVDTNVKSILATAKNPTEMTGAMVREGMTAYIMSPSGRGSESGVITYNCNFYGTEWSKSKEHIVYTKGNYSNVINEVFTRMGVMEFEILFSKGAELIQEDTQVIQYESDFKFIQRMAREWHCIFRIGYTSKGTLYGLFVDFDKFSSTQFSKRVTGASYGSSILLEYKGGVNNVRSYAWQNHAGESGTGDHVKIIQVGGQFTFVRYVAENETVKAYRFVPSLVSKELRRRNEKGGITSMNDYMKWALDVSDFGQIKEYFVPYEESTAPQGVGYSVNIEMLGNPMITPPMIVNFGTGFPENLRTYQVAMFLTKVDHVISKEGYRITAEAMDTLTYTGGSFII